MARSSEVHELMTAGEAAHWFRRSPSWLRRQHDLLRFERGQPMFHVVACRAYVLGRLAGATGAALRKVQLDALAAFCGLAPPSIPSAADVISVPSAPQDRPESVPA